MTKFFENLPVYYINLDQRKDRNLYMVNQLNLLGISNFKRVSAVDKNTISQPVFEMTSAQQACSESHLIAINNFLNSENEFAMICEDDVDLLNAKKINFNFKDILDLNRKDICIQLSTSSRLENNIPFTISKRSFWNFGTISYILNKNYAKKLINLYYPNQEFLFKNFVFKKIEDPRGGSFNTIPVSDELVYSLVDADCVSLFGFIEDESDINSSDENVQQIKKNVRDFKEYWSKFENIDLNIISSEYSNMFTINKNL